MSSKKLLVASTPNRANLNSSNRVPEWNYDSILEHSEEGTLSRAVGETYIISENSETAASVHLDAPSTKSKDSKKTVTPQNEIEIQPEKIKQIRLSFNKPQSRLMNSSSFVAKEPSLPLDQDDESDDERDDESGEPDSLPTRKSKEATKSSSVSSSLSQSSLSATNNANGTKELTSTSVALGTKRKRTLKVVLVKSENTPSSSVIKKIKLSNAASTDNTVGDALTLATATAATSGQSDDENERNTEPDNLTQPNGLLNQTRSKSNNTANKTQANGCATLSLTTLLDSDSETPINRKGISNSSANPTDSFKKKLFSDYFEENSEYSDSSKKFGKYKQNVWVQLKKVDLADICKPPASVSCSSTTEVEPTLKKAKIESRGKKSSSLSRKGLVHLEESDRSKTSKKQYLADWVEEQNTLLNESFEVEVNRRFKAVSRSTQTSDHEKDSDVSSTTVSSIVKTKRGRKKTKTLTKETATKRKSERQTVKKNGTKRVNYKESSISTNTEENQETEKPIVRNFVRTVVNVNVNENNRGVRDRKVSTTKRVARARNPKANVASNVESDSKTNKNMAADVDADTATTAIKEKQTKKAPVKKTKSAKIDKKESDSDVAADVDADTATTAIKEKQTKKAPVKKTKSAKIDKKESDSDVAADVDVDADTATTAIKEKQTKKAPAKKTKSAKIDKKESDSDDMPLIELSKKKSANEKTKPPQPLKKTRANEKSKKKNVLVRVISVAKKSEESNSTTSESESSCSDVEIIASKTGKRARTRGLAQRNARNEEVVNARVTRAKSGTAAKRANKK